MAAENELGSYGSLIPRMSLSERIAIDAIDIMKKRRKLSKLINLL
ncbi:MAG: hypothetical protein WCT26_04825 [Candidatus Buchananbacteria bacterium]|jgi:hypothetical protein